MSRAPTSRGFADGAGLSRSWPMRRGRRVGARGPGSILAVAVALATAAGACAGRLPDPVMVGPATDTVAAWRALAEGRDGDAERGFQGALRGDRADEMALFGDASLAFEQGRVARAVDDYVALVERATRFPTEDTPLLATMALGRIDTLLDEIATSAQRDTVEARLLGLSADRLPWEARRELAALGDRIQRRRADPGGLARVAGSSGCVRRFAIRRPAGLLPHADLDRAVTDKKAAETIWRSVSTTGCRVALPAFEGRPGAQRVTADVDVPGPGTYDIVLDFAEEARVIVDGGPAFHHGDVHRYGPRVSAARVTWARGRHHVEVRLATFGSAAEAMLMIVPASPGGTVPALGDAPMRSPSVIDALSPAEGPTPATDAMALGVARLLARAYVAGRLGDGERGFALSADLERDERFAVGLALAATLARDDPSRPDGFARDRSRTLLERALSADKKLGRAWNFLASLALEEDRPREALETARSAVRASPSWWVPRLTLYGVLRLRGLDWDANRELDRALALAPDASSVLATAIARARDRHDLGTEASLRAKLVTADGPTADEQLDWLRRRGDLAGQEAIVRRLLVLSPERTGAKQRLAAILLAEGSADAAVDLLSGAVDRRDADGIVRLADAQTAAGHPEQARATLAAGLRAAPELADLVRAARTRGVPLPLDDFRLDGRQVIADFARSGRRYDAPAVVLLDRIVTRVFPDGTRWTLNHEIVRVQSKDAIEKWGEVSMPEGAEVLTLRSHKPDGTTREPEEIAGKDSISMPDLAVGDCVEKEVLEISPPEEAFAAGWDPGQQDFSVGFVSDRFYFQAFDAPLDRTEFLVVTPSAMADELHRDARAGAPAGQQSPGPDGTVVTTFATGQVPQLFAERSSVPAIEHVPSVRLSSGVSWEAWARFLAEQISGTERRCPLVARVADELRAKTRDQPPEGVAAAVVAWVTEHIDDEDDLREPASFAIARGRGNRIAVMRAVAAELGLSSDLVFARSRLLANADAATPVEELDDFGDPLVAFDFGTKAVGKNTHTFVDPSLKHAPFGYLPPGLDGARVFRPSDAGFSVAASRADDHRAIDMAIRLDGQGGGVAQAVEALRGLPALQWADLVDRVGTDRVKLRQNFEQRWLGVQFPGAVLKDLDVEILGSDGKPAHPGAPTDIGELGYTASEVRLKYSFSSPRMALRSDKEIRLLPTFFRSQPGRRFATEPGRRTALLMGADIPTGLRARVEVPAGAHLVEPRDTEGGVVSRPDGFRFVEQRQVQAAAGAAPVLILTRESSLPIMRVPPADYQSVAAELRRVDALEQREIRFSLPPARLGGGP